jgi:predicted DNA-binding mobile mystery protein A
MYNYTIIVMKSSYKMKKLKRAQIDRQIKSLISTMKGWTEIADWVDEIREALCMSKVQLANRMGLDKQAYYQIEKSLKKGAISVSSLKKISQALNCRLLITLVPENSLDVILQKQAHQVAARLVAAVSHTMALEKQRPSTAYIKKQVDELTEELILTSDKRIWNKKNENKK